MEQKEEKSRKITARLVTTVAAAVVLVPAAAIANGKAMWTLAVFAHWDIWTAALLPLSLDGLAALSMYMWRRGRTDAARSFGRFTTLAAMVVSVMVAAGGHMAAAGMLEPAVWLVVTVGAIPAVCLVALLELLVLDADIQVGKRKKAKAATPKPETKPEPKVEPIPAAVPDTPEAPPTLTIVPGDRPSAADKVRAAFEALGTSATNGQIKEWCQQVYGTGVSPNRITEVRKAISS